MDEARAALHDELADAIESLSAFGEKRTGTPAGERAADYIRKRFHDAGLVQVRMEPFRFPRHEVSRAAFELWIDGVPRQPAMDFGVLEASGGGRAHGPLVWAGNATPEVLASTSVANRIAVVESNRQYHRSSQFHNVARAGASAMVFVSSAPFNLVQAGSVRATWEAAGPIPAIAIGAEDGESIKQTLYEGNAAHADLEVVATIKDGTGHNIVGAIPGTDPTAGALVIGAHYDTWFSGACDNGGGVAAMLAIAERVARERRRCTVVFAAFDGEELALYGGYDFLRRRRAVRPEPLRCVLNLETPAASGTHLCGLAYSHHAALQDALSRSELKALYPLYLGMDAVPQLFGGIIPTDVQGFYREGTPTMSTAVDAPYYHTREDTPDKVDFGMLSHVVTRMHRAVDVLAAAPDSAFGERDPTLWRLEVTPLPRRVGQPLRYRVAVRDGKHAAQGGSLVRATLLYDDFYPGSEVTVATDGDGEAVLELDGAAADDRRSGFVHITAGRDYPLAEVILGAP